MAGFDIIGDVHGHADRLRSRLTTMGYREQCCVCGHRDRMAVFNPLATCLDYSVAMEGVLRAYRWDDEDEIDETRFVDV